MKIFIMWNGKQIGPYSLAIVESMVEAQTLKLNDLAWYEGLPEWIHVKDIPGFVYRAPRARPRTFEFPASSLRPNFVWFFCMASFFALPVLLGMQIYLLFSLVITPGSFPPDWTFLKDLFPADSGSFTIILVVISILGTLLQLIGAILLFLIRKNALYFYVGAFVSHLVVPSLTWLEFDQGPEWVIFLVAYYGIILWHFGGLKKRGILR